MNSLNLNNRNSTFDTFHHRGMEEYITKIQDNSINKIRITYEEISEFDSKQLAAALIDNTSVEILALGCNSLGDPGALALAETLHVNTTLKKLFLSDNHIGTTGAKALAAA